MTEPRSWELFREKYKAEKGRFPGQFLPPTIYIKGKSIPVTWESAGQVIDDSGHTLEIYIPIVPAGFLTTDIAEALFDQVQAWDVTDDKLVDFSYTKNIPLTANEKAFLNAKKPEELTKEESDLLAKGFREEFHPARETLALLDLTPQSIFNEVKFNSIRQELVNKGADPSTLGIEGVEDFLLEQSQFQQGARIDPAFLEGLGRIMKEVQTNPGNAEAILAKYAPSRPQTEAQQVAEWGQQTFQGQQALQTFWGLPKIETFGTEREYQQNVVSQLGKQAEDILASGVDLRNLNPLTQAQGQIVGQYQASQKRLKDIEAGAEETWTPQIAQEQEAERQRLETEETKRQKAIKPKKSPMDIQFERLLEESRRPQRVTRL